MDVVLHGIEAMPGEGRYAVSFRGANGEQSAVVGVGAGEALDVADANLPAGWTSGTPAYGVLAAAVLAVHRARAAGPPVAALHDVDGGWDVGLGNVVLVAGVPCCTAHGPMSEADGVWECAECGARAGYQS